jgi:hypothetical protein
MTPKEKATEIIEKHYQKIIDIVNVNNAFFYSQQCALTTVDEIISHIIITTNQSGLVRDFQKEYWLEVRKEVEKL